MAKPVLVLLDLQKSITAHLPGVAAIFAPAAAAAAAARAASIPVIFVTVSFRPGVPELPARNVMAARVKAMGGVHDGSADAQVEPALAPAPGDIFVTKRRVSAFAGSDLDAVLRGLGADTLVLAGVATSGAVLSTVRHAADLDFRLIVLRDLCADREDDVHSFLLDRIIPRQADVLESSAWIASLEQP